MNIFVIDECPVVSAQQLADRHCIKMILETAQLLCSVFHLQNIEAPYKLTHKNHPCSIWCRESKSNFNWTFDHGMALLDEYTARYGKIHKSTAVFQWIKSNKHLLSFPEELLTPFVQAMPLEYQNTNPVMAYRNYYNGAKKHLHQWKRNKPDWIKN